MVGGVAGVVDCARSRWSAITANVMYRDRVEDGLQEAS